jgi:hypothetical protein
MNKRPSEYDLHKLIARAVENVDRDQNFVLIEMIDAVLNATNASAADAVAVAGYILYRAAEFVEEEVPGSITVRLESRFGQN